MLLLLLLGLRALLLLERLLLEGCDDVGDAAVVYVDGQFLHLSDFLPLLVDDSLALILLGFDELALLLGVSLPVPQLLLLSCLSLLCGLLLGGGAIAGSRLPRFLLLRQRQAWRDGQRDGGRPCGSTVNTHNVLSLCVVVLAAW